jgi:hypothetical protein
MGKQPEPEWMLKLYAAGRQAEAAQAAFDSWAAKDPGAAAAFVYGVGASEQEPSTQHSDALREDAHRLRHGQVATVPPVPLLKTLVLSHYDPEESAACGRPMFMGDLGTMVLQVFARQCGVQPDEVERVLEELILPGSPRPEPDPWPRITHVVLNHYEHEASAAAGKRVFIDVVGRGTGQGVEAYSLDEFAHRFGFSPEAVERILQENGLVIRLRK